MDNNRSYLGAHDIKCLFNKPQLNSKFLTLDYSLFSKTMRWMVLQPRLQSNTGLTKKSGCQQHKLSLR